MVRPEPIQQPFDIFITFAILTFIAIIIVFHLWQITRSPKKAVALAQPTPPRRWRGRRGRR